MRNCNKHPSSACGCFEGWEESVTRIPISTDANQEWDLTIVLLSSSFPLLLMLVLLMVVGVASGQINPGDSDRDSAHTEEPSAVNTESTYVQEPFTLNKTMASTTFSPVI